MLSPLALFALLAATTATTATTNAQGAIFTPSDSHSIAWPAATFTGAPTRAISGDFTGDDHTDVILLVDDQAVLVYGPGVYDALVPLPLTIVDLAKLPAATAGASDAVVALTPLGVYGIDNYQAGAFRTTPLFNTAPWPSASALVVTDLDGTGSWDAVALSADRRTVLIATDAGSSGRGFSSFALSSAAYDLAVLDWDGSAAIAVLCANGTTVHTPAGGVLFADGGTGIEGGFLTPFRETGFPRERLAVVRTEAGLDYLSVLDVEGADATLALGAQGIYAGAAADVDADGSDDLLLVRTTATQAFGFLNQVSATETFTSYGLIELGAGSALNQTAAPILADLTNDGDADLFVHLEATSELAIFENTTTPRHSKKPTVLGGVYIYDTFAKQGALKLTVHIPGLATLAPTHVQVVGWTQDTLFDATDPVPALNVFLPKGAGTKVTTDLLLDEPSLASKRIYHFEIRAVRRANGETVEAGPAAVWAFATPSAEVFALQEAYETGGIVLRVQLTAGKKGKKLKYQGGELAPELLAERTLLPSTIEGDKVPGHNVPPDPFG